MRDYEPRRFFTMNQQMVEMGLFSLKIWRNRRTVAYKICPVIVNYSWLKAVKLIYPPEVFTTVNGFILTACFPFMNNYLLTSEVFSQSEKKV